MAVSLGPATVGGLRGMQCARRGTPAWTSLPAALGRCMRAGVGRQVCWHTEGQCLCYHRPLAVTLSTRNELWRAV